MVAVRIDRASPTDMMELASDIGPAPRQMGAVLLFDPAAAFDLDDVRAAVAGRIGNIRRFGQRLHRAPWGCGRPIWVDDPTFDIGDHVESTRCVAPGDRRAVLATAAALLTSPLPPERPLWRLTLVEGADTGPALVVVVHHVLADGMGGLAVLARLVDGAVAPPAPLAAAAHPSTWALARDAVRERFRAIPRIAAAPAAVRAAAAELRSGATPRAARSSINRPIGALRRMACVRTDLDPVRALAHAHAASVNDVMVTAVGGAVDALLARRGEHADPIVVSVPVSGRPQTEAGALGNRVGVMPVPVPGHGEPGQRLAVVAAATRAMKAAPRGASAALLAPACRLLGALHALRWVVNHQNLVHTFATNLRGPDDPVEFLGSTVREIVPLNLLAGNVAVAFAVLSYAGSVTVTVTVDPAVIPDLDVLIDALARELTGFGLRVTG